MPDLIPSWRHLIVDFTDFDRGGGYDYIRNAPGAGTGSPAPETTGASQAEPAKETD